MNCYYHPATAAIAFCKNCCRGLCKECAVDLQNGTACKGRCEAEVAAVIDMVQRGKSAYAKASDSYTKVAIFTGMFALAFIGFGLQSDNGIKPFLLILGFILLVSSGLYFHSAKRYRSRD